MNLDLKNFAEVIVFVTCFCYFTQYFSHFGGTRKSCKALIFDNLRKLRIAWLCFALINKCKERVENNP